MDLRHLLFWIKRQSISYSQFLQSYLSLADSIFGVDALWVGASFNFYSWLDKKCPLSFANKAEITSNPWFLLTKANSCPSSPVAHKQWQRESLKHEQETTLQEPIFNTVLQVRFTTSSPQIIIRFPKMYWAVLVAG